MIWEEVLKGRGRSYSKRKKITAHNKPIKNLISKLKREFDDVHSELTVMALSDTRLLVGYEKQMEKINQLQDTLKELRQKIKEQESQLKELPSDRIKGTGRKQVN